MNRLSLITHLSDREQMFLQYQQLIQEHLNEQDSIKIIAICLNNIGTLIYRNEILTKSVFKFIKVNLLHALTYPIQYIVYINMAKIYFQLGMNGKTFLKAELALQFYEKVAFQNLNQSEAILLINGYIILAKSYELANIDELNQIRRKSKLLQNGFKSINLFYENSQKLLIKYVGITHPLYKKFTNIATKKSALTQKSFLINNETNFDNFAYKKSTIQRVMQLINNLKNYTSKNQDALFQTPSQGTTRIKTTNEDSIIKNRFYRIKRSSKCDDDQETTVDSKNKRKSFKINSITKLEKIISNKVEQQVQLHFSKKQQEEQLSNSRVDLDQKYQLLCNEISKIEKEKVNQDKQTNEWKQQIKTLQDEINLLKHKIVETEQLHQKESKEQQYRHLQQIQHLNEQNQQLKLQMNKNILHERNYTTNNNSLDEHQFFYFTDSYSNQVISIPLLHNISFLISQENIQIEIQHILQGLKISAKLNDKILTEFIEIQQLQDFLQYTQYNHTLPYPIKFINNFKTFIQHLLVPFIQIITEQNENRIAIWPYPQGLIQEQSIIFLNQNCQWWIYNIGLKWFRLTVYQQTDFIIQIDIRYDETTFEGLFKQENIDEYELQEKEEILQFLNKSNTSQFQLLESSKTSIHSTYYLPSVQILNKNKLITTMNSLIKEIEQFLNQQQINQTKKIKQNNNKQLQQIQVNYIGNKAQIQSVFLENGQCFVKLKNLYQTHAPNQKQIYAEGCYEIKNDFLKQRYGITFENLVSQEDKIYFYEKLLESFTLQVHNTQLDQDDLDLYKENPIILRELNFGGTYKTFYESNNYRIPILFSLIGTNDIPQFVKIDVYNEDQIDCESILFNVTEEYWIRPVISQVKDKKKKQQKYIKEFKVSGQYYLAQILQQCGWLILEHQLYLNDDKQVFIQRLDTQIGKLEQCINIKSIMELVK